MEHVCKIQIRFADIDKLNHVNNATYLTYVEYARIDYFDTFFSPINWDKEGFILARSEVNYLQPIFLKDQIIIKTYCSRIGNKSFDLSYKIYKIENKIEIEVANALTVLVCYHYETKETASIPAEWKKILSNT